MHPFIHPAEIQDIVFKAIEEPGRDATLQALARTCSAFTDLALDLLWEAQTTFFNVFNTLPEDLCKVRRDEKSKKDPEIIFIREIVMKDLANYIPYARRIRLLDIQKSLGVTEDALSALCLLRPTEVLLPRLGAFNLSCHTAQPKDMTRWLPSVLHTGLTRFSIEAGRSPHITVPLAVTQLMVLCPLLKELEFDCLIVDDGRDRSLPGKPSDRAHVRRRCVDTTEYLARHGFQDIEKLRLRPLSCGPEILLALARYPFLRDLELSFTNSTPYLQNNNRCEFHHLTHLYLGQISWNAASSTLDMLVKTPLQSLKLSINDQYATKQSAFFEEFLSKLARLEHLSYVEIGEEDNDPVFSQGHLTVGLELARLRRIEFFSFVCSSSYLLGDAWFSAISSWSSLSEIIIFSLEHRPILTLEGLLPLIKNCHHLWKLEVAVICNPFHVSPGLKQEIVHSKIGIADFVYSPFGDGMTAATLVDRLLFMFPMAETITGESQPQYREDDPWRVVNALLEGALMDREGKYKSEES